ncbi:MAG TPA: hypothetical protein VN639_07455 [Azonexus sp.]|nr:hypothetical protein [Azonexus sp.]
MKLQHLPIGARFEYKGQVFVKTGPLTAASEEGGQQIIPRSAVLKPLDGPPTEAKGKGREVEEARVLAAFADFHEACSRLVDVTARPQLEAARLKFLRALK